eukprot:5903919-Pleurochrysis_carterae.AAC.2
MYQGARARTVDDSAVVNRRQAAVRIFVDERAQQRVLRMHACSTSQKSATKRASELSRARVHAGTLADDDGRRRSSRASRTRLSKQSRKE